jgi:hypothetical protein
MSPHANQDLIDAFCKLLMDTMQVNPEVRLVIMSLIETLMENQVRQEDWGNILFCVWQELHDEPSHGTGAHNDGSGR